MDQNYTVTSMTEGGEVNEGGEEKNIRYVLLYCKNKFDPKGLRN